MFAFAISHREMNVEIEVKGKSVYEHEKRIA